MPRPGGHAVTCTALVLATAMPAPPPAIASSEFALTFRVVEPDGSPVASPIAMVSVFGRTYSSPQVVHGTGGALRIPVPMADPVVVERIAAGEPVNLLIRVFDKKPGTEGINAAYIGAAVLSEAGKLAEMSDVSGRTFSLEPGKTAFSSVAASDVPQFGADEMDDDPDCFKYGPGTPVPCDVTDYPYWSRYTRIPIAENHGGGAEVMSSIRYHSTHVTKSAFAIQVGKSGFFQGQGKVGFEKESDIALGFTDAGNGVNRRAVLVTEMVRRRTGACYHDPTAAWECQLETTYLPNQAHGTDYDSWPGGHDSLDTDTDCWTYLDGDLGNFKGESKELGYGLELGPSENWATGTQSGLYANTTVTGQTNTRKGHVREWATTSGASYRYHYLYVPGGLVRYDRFQSGGGVGACVENSAPQVRTHASNTNYGETVEVHLDETVDPPPPTDSGYAGRTVCGRMPDKCD